MMDQAHTDYYRRREAQERRSAERASDIMTRRLHEEMAARYRALIAQARAGAGPVE